MRIGDWSSDVCSSDLFVVFVGTIVKRREPHIYVANWFYLSFIVTIAMLHIVNNLSVPATIFGSKSYSAFAGVQDALTQWWYGHKDRKSVVMGKRVSVRVDFGGGRYIKKQNDTRYVT